MSRRCYLDIETTGISRDAYEITVIGLGFEHGRGVRVVQLVGGGIGDTALVQALTGVGTIYTYNGRRFDLPFIKSRLHLDLAREFTHRDLMYDCWQGGLKGGLKRVEERLGISRQTKGIDGWMAVRLWWDYLNNRNLDALGTLLTYNAEDVANLRVLREKLGVD